MTDDTLVAADAERVLEPASKPKGTRQESKARPSGKTRERNNGLLNDLNARYAVILDVGAHCVVADLMPRGDGKAPVQLISVDNFKKRYPNRYASADESSNPKQAGGWWLAHRRRRQYDGLILEPSKPDIVTAKGRQFFNLWRGWGVEPKRGDWSLMREHIRTILANGDPGFDSYIINWSGFAVQHPSERAEVALTFKGKKGSGKTIFAQTLADFFGTQHGKVQTDPKRLTGQFNAFLRDTILLFLDEMRWSSRRDDEGILQTLITRRTICIEDKNIPQYEWPNHLHIVFCSNADRAIPATEGERRYAVGETNNRYAKDMCPDSERETYFNALYKELDNGGREAMLYDLLHLDLGDWHPRVGYRTTALQREKKQGVTGFDAFYQLLLEDGFLPGKTAPFPNKVLTRELYKDMQDRVPELRFVAQNQVGTYFGQARFKQLGLKPWRICEGNGWEFPRLVDLRREWEQRQGGWEWPNDLSEWTSNPSRQDE